MKFLGVPFLLVLMLSTGSAGAACNGPHALQLTIANVEILLSHNVKLRVRRLNGTVAAQAFQFDQTHSYRIQIQSAEVILDEKSVKVLLRDVLPSSLQDLSLDLNAGRIEQTSTFYGFGKFTIAGPLEIDGDDMRVQGSMPRPKWAVRRILARSLNGALYAGGDDRIHIRPLRMLEHLLQADGHLSRVEINDRQLIESFGPVGGKSAPDEPLGLLLYIKPCVYAECPADVRNYARESPAFPHETTADQFFVESQFESYRALGRHIIGRMCGDEYDRDAFLAPNVATFFANAWRYVAGESRPNFGGLPVVHISDVGRWMRDA
jgi:hypothetical protein